MSAAAALWHRRRPVNCGADRAVLARAWRDAEYCVVDVETTGLDLVRDDIISYGAVIIRAGRILSSSCVYGLVRPKCAVSPSSIAVHALRRADLEQAPQTSECVDALTDLLSGRILVAHAAWIEEALLGRALSTSGRRLGGPCIDTAGLTRAVGLWPRDAAREPSLEALSVRMKLPVHTPHHALGDALTTAGVFLALANRVAISGAVVTAADLVALSDQYRRH